MKTTEHIITLSREDDIKLAAKADADGITNDLEYLETKIHEWLNEESRMEHTEK